MSSVLCGCKDVMCVLMQKCQQILWTPLLVGIHTTISAKNSSGTVTEEALFRSPIGVSKNAGPNRICRPISGYCVKKSISSREIMEEFSMLLWFCCDLFEKCHLCQLYVRDFCKNFGKNFCHVEISARMEILAPMKIFWVFLGTENFCMIRLIFAEN